MIGRVKYHLIRLLRTSPVEVYYRDVVRPRILKTPPLMGLNDQTAEIHVLTSSTDWINLVWSLKSFYTQTGRRYALAIHGDPYLSQEAVDGLRSQFPDARIIRQQDARPAVIASLANYPLCRRLRETNTLSIKSFDFVHFLEADRMILFDSDLLFFARPDAYLAHLDNPKRHINVYNPDVATAYAVDIPTIEAHGCVIVPEINSGFGLVHRESMQLDWMEEFLAIPGMMEGHFWRIEQTLFALCGSRFGAELLPDDYRVFLQGGVGNKPYRHYVGAVRGQMYTEGMRRLQKQLLEA